MSAKDSSIFSRSHALRGNAGMDAPRPAKKKIFFRSCRSVRRGASRQAFLCAAWEREKNYGTQKY